MKKKKEKNKKVKRGDKMYMCKGRHLDWYEIKIAMLLRGLGFTDTIIANALGIHKSSLVERLERVRERFELGNKRDLEELIDVAVKILKEEDSYVTKRFNELYEKCKELREAKREMLREMYRRREEKQKTNTQHL